MAIMKPNPTPDPRYTTPTTPTWSLMLVGVGLMEIMSFLVYALRLENISSVEPVWATVGVTGALFVGLWFAMERDNLRRAAASQGARFTTFALLLTVAAVAIAVAVNVIANRYDQRVDLTQSGRFTLAEQSVSIAEGLPHQVSILGFFSLGSPEELAFTTLIDSYQQHTNQLKLDLFDPVSNPMLADQHMITSPHGTVVFIAGDSRQRLENSFGEEAVTNALVRLTSATQHTVCFVTGHDESDPNDNHSPTGLGLVTSKLADQNYIIESVSLFRSPDSINDCAILVAADPTTDWLPAELDVLASYVASGGRFILMLEPAHANALAADMSRYGISVGDDILAEDSVASRLAGGDASYILLDKQSRDYHPINNALHSFTIHPLVRSVTKSDDIAGINVQELAHTSQQSWAIAYTDPESFNPEQVVGTGSLSLMTIAEIVDPTAIVISNESLPTTPSPGGRVLVIGDVDFATNQLIDQGSNLDLLLNSMAWMVDEHNQISIRPNEAAESSISMSLGQVLIVWLLCVLIAPGCIVLGALWTWRTRRRL